MNRARSRWIDALLGVPLAHKLVAASVAVAAFSAGFVVLAARRVAELDALPGGVLVAAAFLLGVLVLGALNGLLVRLALRPIRELERGIRAYARSFSESTGIRVEVAGDGRDVERGLGEEARLTLYRAAQELLMNVVQHPDGVPVRLRLRSGPDAVAVELERPRDRAGRGRSRAGERAARESELVDLRERLAWVGGRVMARQGPAGCRVRAEVPRPASPEPRSEDDSAA